MMKIGCSHILMAMALLTASAVAQNRVEVRPAGEDYLEADPRSTVTTLVRVRNLWDRDLELVTEVIMPEGWKLITQEAPYTLNSQESDLRLLSLYIPQNVPAGDYQVVYRVRGREYPSISDQTPIRVHVLRHSQLVLGLISSPKYAIAGEPCELIYYVSNQSNEPETVDFKAESSLPLNCTVDPSRLRMEPGETQQVTVHVNSDQNLAKTTGHRIHFHAVSESEESESHVTVLKILPVNQREEDRYRRFPVKMSLAWGMQSQDQARSGFQGNLAGQGALDDAGRNHLQFGLRGPDAFEKSMYFEHDAYFVSYNSKWGGLHIGDRNFTLSPLLEQYRFGRGVEGSIHTGRFQLGGYAHRTRWMAPRETQLAAFTSFRYMKDNTITVRYLEKEGREREGRMLDVETVLSPWSHTVVEAEYSRPMKNMGEDEACRFTLSTRHSLFSYHMQFIRAGRDFPGYYHDTRYITNNLSLYFSKRMQLNAAYRQEKQNFDVDTTRYSAPYTEYAQAGIRYSLTARTSLTANWIYQSREDRLPEPNFHYRENSVRLGLGRAMNLFSVNLLGEYGRTQNRITDRSASMAKITGSLQYRPAPGQSYRAYAYYTANNRYSRKRENSLIFGFNMNVQLASALRFYFNFQNNYSREEYYRNRNLLETRLNYTLPFGHEVSLRARHTLIRHTLDRSETSVLAEYTVPLGIRTGTKKSMGFVCGYVIDAESGKPMDRIVVHMNGSSAATNAQGYFVFPALEPRSYYLRIDPTRVGFNRVTVQKTPMEIHVQGGSRQTVELAVTRSASLSGRVAIFPAETKSVIPKMDAGHITTGSVDTVQGIPNVIVELRREDEFIRWVTDREGKFNFDELRPGTWHLRIFGALPENYRLENDIIEVELKPGERKTVSVRVVEQIRRIRMFREGGMLTEVSAR